MQAVTGRNPPAGRRRAWLVRWALFLIAAAAAAGYQTWAEAAARTPIACGTVYTVTRGDTLFKIAERSYADGWKYKAIFEANRDLLPKAESVEIDHQLLIPCLDGSGPADRRAAIALGMIVVEGTGPESAVGGSPGNAVAEDPAAERYIDPADHVAAVAPRHVSDPADREEVSLLQTARELLGAIALPGNALFAEAFSTDEILANADAGMSDAVPGAPEGDQLAPQVRLLTFTDLAPVADAAEPFGGMVGDMVAQALAAGGGTARPTVAFAGKWQERIDYLLPDGMFDVGFPWFKPDCGGGTPPGMTARRLCEDFVFSAPVYEVEIGVYGHAGIPVTEASTPSTPAGLRVCLPQGNSTLDVARTGIVQPEILPDANLTAADCFVRVLRGQADMVVLLKSEGDRQVRDLNLADAVFEYERLRFKRTLHAIAPKGSPYAVAALTVIDRGLAALMMSGRWFEIVLDHRRRQSAAMN